MSDDDRTHGVTFEDFDPEDVDYPISTADLREEHGDVTLDMQGEETTLGEVLAGYDDELQDVEALREAVMTMLPDDAVGREDYSDRGTEEGSGQEADEESL
ncbi:DUF5789 family protein [Halomarina oriensis]|uniref:DUF2795 domain-containing protein n=1 Tax=Halomarina oriensis TaxID=671145 RepID=A0A6B0GN52_9EURY|nr:hypothetical protein [Halomarina oriensis]MWG32998.1 hypothetical protein [Halomarina oriensis]